MGLLVPSALTTLHSPEGDPGVKGPESSCTLQCQGAHSSQKLPILFLETGIS